jgi:hypothetical protein
MKNLKMFQMVTGFKTKGKSLKLHFIAISAKELHTVSAHSASTATSNLVHQSQFHPIPD